MDKKRKGFVLANFLLGIIALTSCTTYQYGPEDFDAYMQEYMQYQLGSSPINWNIFYNDPYKVGYTDSKNVSWYSYHKYSTSDLRQQAKALNRLISDFKLFDYNALSDNQKATYDSALQDLKIDQYFYQNFDSTDFLLRSDYVSSDGGYVSSFADSMRNYNLRSSKDVDNVIEYVNSTTNAFNSYLEYASDRVECGFPLVDNSLNGMISYLDSITSSKDTYYLKPYLNEKINKCDFLTADEKNTKTTELNNAFENAFYPSVENLSTHLREYLGKTTNNDYLAVDTSRGQKLYRYLFAKNFCLNPEEVNDTYMSAYSRYLDTKIVKYNNELYDLVNEVKKSSYYTEFTQYLEGSKCIINTTDANEMIPYLKEFAKTVVRPLENEPNIEISEMDETVQQITSAVAYYRKSAIDVTSTEYITINPAHLENPNELLFTMSHEGYPGHLYAYCLLKEEDLPDVQKSVLSCVGHAEGWAVYVETLLADYISNNTTNEAIKAYCKYFKLSTLLNYIKYTRLDLAFNYEARSISVVAKNYNLAESSAQKIHDRLIEMPVQYSSYGYGAAYFVDIHENTKANLTDRYDEIEYNYQLLRYGWVGFGQLKEISDNYVKEKNNNI